MTNQEKVSPVISVVEDVALTSNRDGCVTAEVYSSIEEEYKCVRSSVGISDLSHYGRIRVSGQSGQDLINSLTLSDVATVPINEMQSTFILADDGAPLCEAFICNYGDSYLVLSEGSDPTQLLGLMEALSEDRFPDAQVTDESGSLGVIGLDGPFSWELLKAIMGIGVIGIRYLELVPEQSLESIEFTLGRAGKSGEYGYLLICDLSEFVALWGHLTNLGKDFDMRPLGYRVLDLCKLENRFVSQHNEGKVVSNVLELNTRVMFNIDKGEHAGRDSLEKIMACGVERRVIGVRRAEGDDAELEKGLRVSCGGEQIGELVNAGFSSVLNSWIGLALVDADYAYVGLEYSLESDKESTNAKTVSAPFVFNRSMDLRPQEESYLD